MRANPKKLPSSPLPATLETVNAHRHYTWTEILHSYEGHWVALSDVEWRKERPSLARVRSVARSRIEVMREVSKNGDAKDAVVMLVTKGMSALREHPESAGI